MLEQLIWSFTHRPYVTLFMVFFLLLSWLEQGWTRTLLWVLSSYLIALAAEWGSINHGIPFGVYTYHYDALSRDLVLFGVPFFDTLSFSFLSYISFSFAQFFMSPLSVTGLDVQRITTPTVRRAWPTILLGSFLMMVVDLIVDPIANLGRFWFLGDIYHYPDPGVHFGVTFANYCGWFVVALTTLLVNRWIDIRLERRDCGGPRLAAFPGKGLFAPLFWAGIVGFQLGVTWWVALSGQPGLDAERTLLQAVTGSYILAPILLLAAVQLVKPSNRLPAA
jgi:putative membrane protein